jgi:hypothetical protein
VRRQVADALATTPLDLNALLDKARTALASPTAGGYRRRQAGVEASRMTRLLETPVEVTGPDPSPTGSCSPGWAPIWRVTITVTEPIGAALIHVALRKFVK